MGNGEPALRKPRSPLNPWLAGLAFPICGFQFLIGLVLLGGWAGPVWAQGASAVVTGAERVFVRRGPGTEFPPFATLVQGTTVEIKEMQGEWARIATGSGQVGYVNSNFLAPRGEAEHPSAPAPAPGHVQPTPATSDAPSLRALSERNKALDAEIQSLQAQLSDVSARATAAPTPAPSPGPTTGGADQLRGDLSRLTVAVETLQRRLDAAPANESPMSSPPGPMDGAPRALSSAAVVLGVLGLLVGWLLGSRYGRRQERGRRSRVRF